MIKRMSILTRRPDVAPETFRAHWFDIHPAYVKRLEGVRGYVQNLWLGPGPNQLRPPGPHRIDGIVELWFDDEASMDRAFASPQGREAMADGQLFIATVTTFVVEERVCIPGPRGRAKFMSVFGKHAHVDQAALRQKWGIEHPPFVRRGLPTACRYVQNQVIDARHRHVIASGGGPSVDGFVEISWPTPEALAADFSSDGVAAMRAHADDFIALISGSQIEERVVLAPPL